MSSFSNVLFFCKKYSEKCTVKSLPILRVPSDMLHTSKLTTKRFAEGYDQHGDSYTEDTTVDQLKRVFKKIDEEVISYRIYV